MRENKLSLAIHESFPFEVTYFKEDGESYCKVKQDDLEKFKRESDKANKRLIMLVMATTTACLVMACSQFYLHLNPVKEYIIYDVPTSQVESIGNKG